MRRVVSGLALAVLVTGALSCRKPARAKIVNPLIDSAYKFETVFTETIQREPTGIELLLGERPLPAGRSFVRRDTAVSLGGQEGVERGSDQRSNTRQEEGITVLGTVRFISLEGGFWGIVTEEGGQCEPLNLPEELKQEGLVARFTVRIRKDVATTRMWGTPVEILKYQKKKS